MGNILELSSLTVLCSNYNSARWVKGYCQNLNNQLLTNFDIVVVDAASTDNSLEVLKSFEFRNGITVKILECKERVSIYQAWNMATEIAATQYCINVNVDDRLFPSALLTMLSYARAEPAVDLFYSRCLVTLDPDHLKYANMFDYPEFSHDALLRECICGPFPMWKRETIVQAGLFNTQFQFAGDYEMWLRLSAKGYSFRKVPEIIGSYFYNPQGISTDVRTKQERILENETIQRLYRR